MPVEGEPSGRSRSLLPSSAGVVYPHHWTWFAEGARDGAEECECSAGATFPALGGRGNGAFLRPWRDTMAMGGSLKPTLGVLRAVISSDTSSQRFEEYSNATIAKLTGYPVVSTSASWDLGRDGRAAAGPRTYVCATLNEGLDKKAKKDICRLKKHAGRAKVYYCSSQPISEERVEKLRMEIAGLAGPQFEIELLGSHQLAELDLQLTARDPNVIALAHYRGEIQDCLRMLREDREGAPEDRALRLALLSMGPAENGAIRSAAMRNAVLEVFVPGAATAVSALSVAVATALGLPRAPAEPLLRGVIAELQGEGCLDRKGDILWLTPKGVDEQQNNRENAALNFLAGRNAIRAHLEELLEMEMKPEVFDDLWGAVEARLSLLLYRRGEEIVNTALDLLESKTSIGDAGYQSLLEDLAGAAAATWSDPDVRPEIVVAVRDLFTEGEGPACDWLIRACAGFVAACSLGLEATSGEAILKAVSAIEIVPDTDVVLSILGEGEPSHREAEATAKQWIGVGGRIYLAEPVLREVAYQAWMAGEEFEQVTKWFPGTREDGLRLLRTVFVRSFGELVRKKRVAPQQWGQYIRQYRGADRDDFATVHALLEGEYQVQDLPSVEVDGESLAKSVYEALVTQIRQRERQGSLEPSGAEIEVDKAKRDAEIIAAIARRRRALAQTAAGGSCCLISSSNRLARLPELLRKGGESTPWVMSLASWTFLLSLCPGVSFTLEAMKAFLFERSWGGRTSMPETVILRAFKESGAYRLPWAKRVTLLRNIRESVLRSAKMGGESRRQVEKALQYPTDSGERGEVAASVLAEAIDKTALESTEEGRLRKRVAELEREVEELRAKKR